LHGALAALRAQARRANLDKVAMPLYRQPKAETNASAFCF
jgi:hypothetical protein